MEHQPLEIKRAIWSNITSDEDLQSCALVNWEWYDQYFSRKTIGEPKLYLYRPGKKPERWLPYKREDMSIDNGTFVSETLIRLDSDCVQDSGTNLINKFEPEHTEWYNKAYTPYIAELNLRHLNFDVKTSRLKFTSLKTIVGDVEQLLSLFSSYGVIQMEQLKNLSVNLTSQSILDKAVDQLFDKLSDFNVNKLKIKIRDDRRPKIAMEMSGAVAKFLGQLTQLHIRSAFFGPEIFQYLSNLEVFSMAEIFWYCKEYYPVTDRNDLILAKDYLGEICENISAYAKSLKSVTIRDCDVVLEGLTSRGFELISGSGKMEHVAIVDDIHENRHDVNIFTLSLDGIRDFSPFFGLKKLAGLSVYNASTLSKLGLACRQLEAIEMQIEVDFSLVSSPNGTILFPNLIRSDERVVSTNTSKCICSFVQAHMPRVVFNGYGIFCLHCDLRHGEHIEDLEIDHDPMYPRWTGFTEKDCPNLRRFEGVLREPAIYFEECD